MSRKKLIVILLSFGTLLNIPHYNNNYLETDKYSQHDEKQDTSIPGNNLQFYQIHVTTNNLSYYHMYIV